MFLGIIARVLHTKNQLPTPKTMNCRADTDTQTDRQTEIVKTEGTIEIFLVIFFYFYFDKRSNKLDC